MFGVSGCGVGRRKVLHNQTLHHHSLHLLRSGADHFENLWKRFVSQELIGNLERKYEDYETLLVKLYVANWKWIDDK